MHKGMTLGPSWPLWRRWLAACDALWHDLIGAWRVARARAPQPIDGAALRDLGLCRSELQSYLAEVDGTVEATRIRVIRQRQSTTL